jgi:hypothetical protein
MRVHIPSARNLEIYHFLEDDGDSIREVAHRFRVSATRITQIHDQVDRWYRCSAPDPEMDRYRRQDAVASCKRHKVRAGRMYGRMMDAFRDSQGEQKRSREALSGGTVTTTIMSHGDPKYLTFALRYSKEQLNAALTLAKLPDEYFVPPDVEYVAPTEEEMKVEEEEGRELREEEEDLGRRASAYMQKMEDYMAQGGAFAENDEEDDEDFEADASPNEVCTAHSPAAPLSAASPAAASGATTDADAASEVADILRRQHRREAKRPTAPVQPRSLKDRRNQLARALAG